MFTIGPNITTYKNPLSTRSSERVGVDLTPSATVDFVKITLKNVMIDIQMAVSESKNIVYSYAIFVNSFVWGSHCGSSSTISNTQNAIK